MQSPFGRTCHGTAHRPEWLSFAEFMNRSGKPAGSSSPPEPQGQPQGRQRRMPYEIMFTKLGPSNIPPHLRHELGPDQDFIVDPSRSEVLRASRRRTLSHRSPTLRACTRPQHTKQYNAIAL